MIKFELWRAFELLVLTSERELFQKRKIHIPSFFISESELRACFINFRYFQSLLSINEIENVSLKKSELRASEPRRKIIRASTF